MEIVPIFGWSFSLEASFKFCSWFLKYRYEGNLFENGVPAYHYTPQFARVQLIGPVILSTIIHPTFLNRLDVSDWTETASLRTVTLVSSCYLAITRSWFSLSYSWFSFHTSKTSGLAVFINENIFFMSIIYDNILWQWRLQQYWLWIWKEKVMA